MNEVQLSLHDFIRSLLTDDFFVLGHFLKEAKLNIHQKVHKQALSQSVSQSVIDESFIFSAIYVLFLVITGYISIKTLIIKEES